MSYRRRYLAPSAAEAQAETRAVNGISKTVGNAIIGLLVTLIGTGIVAMLTLYVQVGTLAVTVRQTSEALNKHLGDSVSEKQYQRDNSQIWDAIRQMVTKGELGAIQQQLNDHGTVLHKIEDRLEQQGDRKR